MCVVLYIAGIECGLGLDSHRLQPVAVAVSTLGVGPWREETGSTGRRGFGEPAPGGLQAPGDGPHARAAGVREWL